MKRKICLLCAAVIFALALPAFRASAEAYDPMAWQEGVTIYLEAISFEGPHIGVPVPSGNRWLSTKRKAIPADGFAEAWQITARQLSESVPVRLEYTLHVRNGDGAEDAAGELADWLAQHEGDSGRYYMNGRPCAWALYAGEDGQRWTLHQHILYDRIILDACLIWEHPERPVLVGDSVYEPANEIAIDGRMAEITDEIIALQIRSPGIAFPGQEVQCTALDALKKDVTGDVTWSTEDGRIDERGQLAVSPDAREGDRIIVTAVRKDGSASAQWDILVMENTLGRIPWKTVSMGVATGFGLPVPDVDDLSVFGPQGDPCYESNKNYEYTLNCSMQAYDLWMNLSYRIEFWNRLPATRPEQVKMLEEWTAETGGVPERFSMNGWPGVFTVTEDYEDGDYLGRGVHYRMIYDLSGNSRGRFDLDVLLWWTEENALPDIGREEALRLLSRILLKDEPAAVIAGDPAPVIRGAEEDRTITAGEQIRYELAEEPLADPLLGGVVWEAFGADGKPVGGVKIKDGLLEAGKGIRGVTDLTVRARYKNCDSAAETKVTVLPQLQKVAILPEERILYLGGGQPLALRAAGDPEGAVPGRVEWSADREDVAELTVNPDGTAALRPLQAGTVKVTATDESGKKGTAAFTAAEPVTAVEIRAKGAAAPGKTVMLTAVTTPEKPARKDVEWSVDAGEDIAVIDAKGRLKIAKTAPAGTVITVTCRALGAPEPVEAVLEITVE